jgi:hypothetical protein
MTEDMGGGTWHPHWCDTTRCRGREEHLSERFVLEGQVPLVVEVFQRAKDPVPLLSLLERDDEGYVTMPLLQGGPLASVLEHVSSHAQSGAGLDPPGTGRATADDEPAERRCAALRRRQLALQGSDVLLDTGECRVQTHPVHGIVMRGAVVRVEEDGETVWAPARS